MTFVALAVFSFGVKSHLLDFQRPLSPAVDIGNPAPPFELPDLTAEPVRLASRMSGHELTAVVFWASWCQPCRLEMRRLAALKDRHGDRLAVLAVGLDDDHRALRDYVSEHHLPFPVLLDPEGLVAARYGVRAVPTTFLVDREGTVRRVLTGSRSYLSSQVDYLLSADE